MLYAMGWIGLFVIGGVTGLMLASTALDGQVHDTYFVVAHFHYIMVGATVVAFLGGIHFWWPKITGRHILGALGTGVGAADVHRLQHDLRAAIRFWVTWGCRGDTTSIRHRIRC